MTTFKKTELGASAPLGSLPAGIRQPQRILVAGLGLGILVDYLFYGKPVGIGLLLFVLLAVGALWRIGRLEQLRVAKRHLWLLLPLLFFAGMAALRANPYLTFFNVTAVLILLAYLLFFWGNGRIASLGLMDIFLLPWRVGGSSAAYAAPVVAHSANGRSARRGRRQIMPVLRGLLFGLPIFILFTILLASADLIFADYVENILNLQFVDNLAEWAWRGLLILLAGWLFTGGLVLALARRQAKEDASWLSGVVQQIPRRVGFGFTETAVILSLINLLFLAFVAIQFAYLFGGQENIRIEGFTYAEYARRGFFELLTVAILSVGLIVGLNWLAQRSSKRQIKLFNGLGSLTIAFVLILLLSAWRRMALYEAAYGYTFLRLFVYVFMAWLGAALVWFLLTLWRRPDWFALGVLLTAAGFLITLNLLNPDAFIARQNLARYKAAGDLDAAYLTTLSHDAAPYLSQAMALTRGETETFLTPACTRSYWPEENPDCYATQYDILRGEVDGRYQTMSANPSWRKWQSFNWARWQAYKLYEEIGD
ncbi:MAG: DUF4173 domain-containing protein [Chloroflexi bacterium]|nr:DUF4173 domain-containing protein [Chloroflexota bacterium]